MKEVETINGFDIPKRKLTEEEKTRDITVERIRDFHYSAGEDFIDTTEEGNGMIFCGWLLHKRKEHSKEILDICNKSCFKMAIQEYMNASFYDYNKEMDIESFYFDYVEFVNQTGALKERVNQVLIQIEETYN